MKRRKKHGPDVAQPQKLSNDAALIDEGLPLVHQIAVRVFRQVCCMRRIGARRIDVDDLESAGKIGLMQAVHRFDAARGVPFLAFAGRRIHGAIMDDVRQSAALSRGHWQEVKDGTDFFFEEPLSDYLTENTPDRQPSPEHLALVAAAGRRARRAIAALPSWRMRRVMARFERDETQGELMSVLGVGASRVAQLEHEAIRQIRAQLQPVKPKRLPLRKLAVDADARAQVYAADAERARRAKAVENGKRGAAIYRQLRRPKGGFGAHRVA